MIESFGSSVEKVAEKAVEKTVTFFDKFELTVEVAKPEITKKEEFIKTFWDSLEEIQDTNDNSEKSLYELIADYYDDLKVNSEYPETIDDSDTNWEKQSPEVVAEQRKDFNENKEKLIKEWEDKNGKEWPRYEEDVYSKSGKLIRHKGDRYDAHHIKPLSQGGKNEASNITPIHASKHFDKQGVHSPESPYGKIEQKSQGGQL